MVFIGSKDELIKPVMSYLKESKEIIVKDFEGKRGVTFDCLNYGKERKHPLIVINGDFEAEIAIATLAHEAVHAVRDIAKYVGIYDNEFEAQGVGAVMRAVLRIVKFKNNQSKDGKPENKHHTKSVQKTVTGFAKQGYC